MLWRVGYSPQIQNHKTNLKEGWYHDFSSCLWFSKGLPHPFALYPSWIWRKNLPASDQYFWEGTNFTKKTWSTFAFPVQSPCVDMRIWLQNCCSAFSLATSILSMLWHYLNNPRPGPRTVGLLGLQRMLIKIRHPKVPVLHLTEGGIHGSLTMSWCLLEENILGVDN